MKRAKSAWSLPRSVCSPFTASCGCTYLGFVLFPVGGADEIFLKRQTCIVYCCASDFADNTVCKTDYSKNLLTVQIDGN